MSWQPYCFYWGLDFAQSWVIHLCIYALVYLFLSQIKLYCISYTLEYSILTDQACTQKPNKHRSIPVLPTHVLAQTHTYIDPIIISLPGSDAALNRCGFFCAVCSSVCLFQLECLPVLQPACLCQGVCVFLLSSAAVLLSFPSLPWKWDQHANTWAHSLRLCDRRCKLRFRL